ncbi:phthiocerol/phthiodiolone dimycocerosyl transferase-like enzyme [Nocardia tenerifensis]|uniref:Phthiocerol/phthiodiolone dimycocerosyl transferase n=1 Tax=Nocardia tenerifensis TaxID=228006 RepID=A0A318JX77_9NOCA|nr:hypothetical protein [Nocardia tenerifensis]PXX61558.1 phthiocerol/phthiodiolone dimycocerosyl transferase-like enzyme [Nocardia tenerifensis]
MTTSTVVRPLAPSELVFAGIGVYVGYAVRVSGRLDLAALSAAYEAVVRAYPVLGARLEPSGDGGYDLLGSGGAPEISVVDDDSDRLLVDPKLDQREALSAVCVVRDGDTASVTLLTHHSIVDAYHSLAVLAELWSCYTDAVAGRSPERAVREYPASIEQLLAERGIEKMDYPAADESMDTAVSSAADPAADTITSLFTGEQADSTVSPTGDPSADTNAALTAKQSADTNASPTAEQSTDAAVAPTTDATSPTDEPVDEDGWQRVPSVSRCHLSQAETAALVELGHREGVTINGLVSAAILLGEAELREVPLTDLLYLYPVDLRTRITPMVGRTDGTNLLGFANYLPTEPLGLVDLARSICASLRDALAAGIVQQTPLHIPDLTGSAATPHPGMVLVTNWGRVPELRTPEGLRINDFRSTLTSTSNPDVPIPPQQRGATCILSTFDGRLSIEIHHSKAAAALQQRRIDRYAAHLRGVLS